MASQIVIPQAIQLQQGPQEKPLTQEELDFNALVCQFENTVKDISATITSDMQVRQMPNKEFVPAKIYGPKAANRSALKTFNSLVVKIGDIASKLKKGKTKKNNGPFVGSAIPSFVDPVIAKEMGMREGNVLWRVGERPILSAALITDYFVHRVMSLGLFHTGNIGLFRCDEHMKLLFTPFIETTFDKEGKKLSFDALNHSGIQALARRFVVKKDASKGIAGPVLDPKTEYGALVIKSLKALEEKFAALKKDKENFKASLVMVSRCEQDVLKAKAEFDKGNISQQLFDSYVADYKNAIEKKNEIHAVYVANASQLGITRGAV